LTVFADHNTTSPIPHHTTKHHVSLKMAQQAATPLQQALRGILVADLAMKRAKGPDEWMAAVSRKS
jgi:hypothetical protein